MLFTNKEKSISSDKLASAIDGITGQKLSDIDTLLATEIKEGLQELPDEVPDLLFNESFFIEELTTMAQSNKSIASKLSSLALKISKEIALEVESLCSWEEAGAFALRSAPEKEAKMLALKKEYKDLTLHIRFTLDPILLTFQIEGKAKERYTIVLSYNERELETIENGETFTNYSFHLDELGRYSLSIRNKKEKELVKDYIYLS